MYTIPRLLAIWFYIGSWLYKAYTSVQPVTHVHTSLFISVVCSPRIKRSSFRQNQVCRRFSVVLLKPSLIICSSLLIKAKHLVEQVEKYYRTKRVRAYYRLRAGRVLRSILIFYIVKSVGENLQSVAVFGLSDTLVAYRHYVNQPELVYLRVFVQTAVKFECLFFKLPKHFVQSLVLIRVFRPHYHLLSFLC